MLPSSLNALFLFRCLFNFGKTLTTENTENKPTPKICKITCTARTVCQRFDLEWEVVQAAGIVYHFTSVLNLSSFLMMFPGVFGGHRQRDGGCCGES